MEQAFPVILGIRNSEGEVRWMEGHGWLHRVKGTGRQAVERIVFDGTSSDVMRVRRWQKQTLGGG
jgi:hypothetical protein